ncbi:MAG: hypothetical protein KUF79_17425 [Candidatus Thiodiazotropha sp. (ex Ctena orbiculata)]|nr:hypothetical protein [Candidatus Thiodiazotropha taylori]PUB73113.1 MAG: hypothetical protein DBO99_20540 [gamma proteobacterium symbiont of Ctena orbiculata]
MVCKDLPPYFYDGGILPEELEEDIDYEEYPFLPSQAVIIRKELSEAAKRGGKDENLVSEAWKQVKEHADIARMQLIIEWRQKRWKKKLKEKEKTETKNKGKKKKEKTSSERIIQDLKRLVGKSGSEIPSCFFDVFLYGISKAGIMEPEWHDKPDPDDGSHPGEPYIRQLSVKEVRKAVIAACDPNGMLYKGEGGRPNGSIHEDYINEVVKIWVNLDDEIPWSRTTNPIAGKKEPTGPLIRYVTACLYPVYPVPDYIGEEGIVKILTDIRNRMKQKQI